MAVEQQKWFNRNFEKTYGHLTVDQLPKIDFSQKDHIEALFPLYKREQIKAERAKGGNKKEKTVVIEGFELWTPTKDKILFKNTTLTIEPNKRCAVYGENGSGKTMLFRSLALGEVRDFPVSTSVHHMQEMSMDEKADAVSVIDTVTCSHPLLRVLMCLETGLTALIEAAAEEDADKMVGYKDNLEYVQRLIKSLDGYTSVERASKMLVVLGFDKKGEASLMSSLSGGLRMRVALAAAFFINPDLLLLDEPTNHLDLPSVLWLENKLRGYSGSFLLVTHDRHLLENVVTSVMKLQDLSIVPFSTGFAQFEKDNKKLDEQREKDCEKFLMRNRNIDPMSPAYRQKVVYQEWSAKRQRRLVQMQGKFTFQAPKELPNPGKLPLLEIPLITVKDVRFSYDVAAGLPFIFDNPISYTIKMGTRVGIMGPNGAGKSTFLKLVTGKIFPVEGTVEINPDFVLAYFGQHSTKEMSLEDTALEFMAKSFPKANRGELKSHLEKTSIDGSVMEKRMVGLSFSQRSCVVFAKLTFVPPHLLIMDEPTNFLDLDSVDALIGAANKFVKAGGALITVTHNRDFLKRCSETFLSITPGAFLEYSTMKEAERATYSFIGALERGEDVDHKAAIQENRGGGAIHTEEYLAAKELHRKKLDAAKNAAQSAEDVAKAEEAAKLAARELKAKERVAKQKLDWAKDDDCWAAIPESVGGKKVTTWKLCKVVRNVPAMGVTIQLPNGGKTMMTEAKKLKTENPEGSSTPQANAPRPSTAPQGRGNAGGRGGQQKGGARGGGRGGDSRPNTGGRGGARGGARGGGRGK